MRVRLHQLEATVAERVERGPAQVTVTRFVNVEAEENTKTFLQLLKRQLILRSRQVRRLGKSLEVASMENPFTNSLLKGPKKKSKVHRLASLIAQEDDLAIFGFIQKEVAFVEASKAVLEYMKEIQRNSDYCRDLGRLKPTEESPIESARVASQKSDMRILEKKKQNFVSFSANPSDPRTESVQVNSSHRKLESEDREFQTSQSASKPRKETSESVRQYTHVKEKIGENRYIYRLSSRARSQTSDTIPEISKKKERENLEREVDKVVASVSREMETKTISEMTEPNSQSRVHGTFSLTGQHEILQEKVQEAKATLDQREEEILRLKEKNEKLTLESRELRSINQVGLDRSC